MGTLISNLILIILLIYASYIDIKTHTIDDKIHFAIILLGICKLDFFVSICGMFISGVPLFIAAFVSKDKIGGGDVKLMLALGFYLGASKGYVVLVLGLFLIVAYGLFNKNKSLPLAPFFGVSSIVTLFF